MVRIYRPKGLKAQVRGRLAAALALASQCMIGAPAVAGPPYLSDDPEPTDVGHWEIYNFVTGEGGAPGLAGEGGFDINYGAAKDLQLTAVVPLAFENARGLTVEGLNGGPGDLQLAIKYRFLHQQDAWFVPDVSIFPRVFAPTASRRFGSGDAGLLVPLWAEKDLGPWSLFGGGGYQFNPGAGQRDFWQGGVALSRSLSDTLSLGAELFGQGRDELKTGAFETLNVAVTDRFSRHWSLLASCGPTWDRVTGDGYVFYFALKADY
jgi:hypothetical protein